jgi:Fe2+ transport system protein B
MVMTGWEWFGLFVFIIILLLLFFAAFGGSAITDESVEEYMRRLVNERAGDGK